MASLNRYLCIGNLTRDPELRFTPQGKAVAQFGLAINRKYTTESGEARDEVTFIDIEAWGKTAEVLAQYVKKGAPLFVEGRLKLESWDDKTTGQKRSKLKVVLESFQFLGGKQDDGGQAPAQRPAAQGAQSAPARPKPAGPPPGATDGPTPDDDSDNLPF